jgi:hypothetical protein
MDAVNSLIKNLQAEMLENGRCQRIIEAAEKYPSILDDEPTDELYHARKQAEKGAEYIKQNKEHQEEIKDIIEEWKQGNWSKGAGEENSFVCVVCGNNFSISKGIMEFYNWQPDRYICWNCQNKNK